MQKTTKFNDDQIMWIDIFHSIANLQSFDTRSDDFDCIFFATQLRK